MNPNPTILITGAAGLIGNAVCRQLNSQGYTNLILVDRLGLSPQKWKNLRGLNYRDYIEADDFYPNLDKFQRSFGPIDTVIALGARSHTTEKDATFLVHNNFESLKSLWDLALSHGAKFVYASSAATYGDGKEGMDDFDPDITKYRPLNSYGLSKQMFDTWAMNRGILSLAVGLKFFNVFGPPEAHKADQRSIVLKAYDSLCAGQPIQLFRSYHPDYPHGGQKRDFLYVEDAAKVTIWFALDEVGRRQAGLFNIGSETSHTFIELAQEVVKGYIIANGGEVPMPWAPEGRQHDDCPYVELIDMPESIRGQYQYDTKADVRKLREAGYTEPMWEFGPAVRDYVGRLAREKRESK